MSRRARGRWVLPPDKGSVPRAVTALVKEIFEAGDVPVLVSADVVDLPPRLHGGVGSSSAFCL